MSDELLLPQSDIIFNVNASVMENAFGLEDFLFCRLSRGQLCINFSRSKNAVNFLTKILVGVWMKKI